MDVMQKKLIKGTAVENAIKTNLKEAGWSLMKKEGGLFYDFVCIKKKEVTGRKRNTALVGIEVKSEIKYSDSPYLCIEYKSWGHPSNILTTSAAFYVHVAEKIYLYSSAGMRSLIFDIINKQIKPICPKTGEVIWEKNSGGDGGASQFFLISKKYLEESNWCQKLDKLHELDGALEEMAYNGMSRITINRYMEKE